MKIKRPAALAAFLVLLTSCIYEARFTDLARKTTVYGSYNTLTKNISVTLPDGGRFEGKYFPLDPEELGEKRGSLFQRVDVSTYLGLTPEKGWKDYRAVLKSGGGAMMEVIFRYNGSLNSGYGEARTDTGAEYRVLM